MNLLRRMFRRAHGGRITPAGPTSDSIPAILSPGRWITDPDEAEALGMTATARRLREHPVSKETLRRLEGHEPGTGRRLPGDPA